jgi:hypothetical protein
VTGEISVVRIELAGMGNRTVRIANFHTEIQEWTIRNALAQYGDVKYIQDESWSRAYRYNVPNGVKVITMTLNKNLPSQLYIAGTRVMAS